MSNFNEDGTTRRSCYAPLEYSEDDRRIDEIISTLTNDDSKFLDMLDEVITLIRIKQGWKTVAEFNTERKNNEIY